MKKLIEKFDELDCAHCDDSPIGSYYHDKEGCVKIAERHRLEGIIAEIDKNLSLEARLTTFGYQELMSEKEEYQNQLKEL